MVSLHWHSLSRLRSYSSLVGLSLSCATRTLMSMSFAPLRTLRSLPLANTEATLVLLTLQSSGYATPPYGALAVSLSTTTPKFTMTAPDLDPRL